ncbi:MAG: head-tail adaptor protein [Pseudomonadota bacterium]
MSRPRLTHRLTLETPGHTADGAGGYTKTWTALGVLWAELRARAGRERDAGGVPMSRQGYKITVRAAPYGHPERPMPEQRFRDGQRIFRIRSVAEADPGGRHLICFADEEVVS